MGVMRSIRFAAVVLLLTCTVARAQECVSAVESVSQGSVLPNRSAEAVAWNGSTLLVAKVEHANARSIWVATYGPNLDQRSPDRQVGEGSNFGVVALLSNGTDFALFYEGAGNQLTMQRVSATGDLIGGPIALPFTGANAGLQEYDIVWDPSRNAYVIVRAITIASNRGLWMTTVSREGAILTDQLLTIFIADAPAPRVAVGSNGELGVTWRRADVSNEALYFFSIDRTLQPITQRLISVAGYSPRIAWDGSAYVIVYSAPTSGGGEEFRVVAVDREGRLASPDESLLLARGEDQLAQHLMWNPTLGEFALSYLESTPGFGVYAGVARLLRFQLGSEFPKSDSLFAPDPSKNIYGMRNAFVWTGSAYVGAITRTISTAEGNESYLVRHCPLLANILVDREVAPFPYVFTFTAAPSGGAFADRQYSWDFGDFTSPANGQTVRHGYSVPGTYTVTLTVRDTLGSVSTATKIVTYVTDPIPRSATLSASATRVASGTDVTFQGALTSSFPASQYIWTFGDGTTVTGTSPTVTHRYASGGQFTVRLTIVDSSGTAVVAPSIVIEVTGGRRRVVRR